MRSLAILTVCLNSEKTIKSAIESVISQTFRAWTMIIKDGGSKDRTADIVREYTDPRIRFVPKPDRGISEAFNQALDLVEDSEFILYMNSDDRLAGPNALADAMKAIAADRASGAGSTSYFGILNYVEGDRIIKPVGRPFNAASPALLDYCRWPIPHGALFVETKIAKNVGEFRKDLKYAMDFDWMLRLLNISQPKFIPVIIANMERQGVSVVNAAKTDAERLRILRELGKPVAASIWLIYFNVARFKSKFS